MRRRKSLIAAAAAVASGVAGPGVRESRLDTDAAREPPAVRGVVGAGTPEGVPAAVDVAGAGEGAAEVEEARLRATTAVRTVLSASHCFSASARGARNVKRKGVGSLATPSLRRTCAASDLLEKRASHWV